MNSTPKQAQSEQITNLFKHRFDATQTRDPIDVQDAFNLMAERAQGVLLLLHSQFDGEARMSNAAIQSGIDAAFYEVEDMKAVIGAYFDAHKEGEK